MLDIKRQRNRVIIYTSIILYTLSCRTSSSPERKRYASHRKNEYRYKTKQYSLNKNSLKTLKWELKLNPLVTDDSNNKIDQIFRLIKAERTLKKIGEIYFYPYSL